MFAAGVVLRHRCSATFVAVAAAAAAAAAAVAPITA